MTREDAYYEQIMLLCGFWDHYDAWLDSYLEREDPLSDVVPELLDCRGNIKQAEHCLRLYCLEKPFDEESVYTRLRLYLRDQYADGGMKKDAVMSALFRFSKNIPPCSFQNHCLTLSDYCLLADEGIIDVNKFDRVLLNFLNTGEYFDTKAFWN